MQTVYEAVGGFEGMLRLALAWHARVLADEVDAGKSDLCLFVA